MMGIITVGGVWRKDVPCTPIFFVFIHVYEYLYTCTCDSIYNHPGVDKICRFSIPGKIQNASKNRALVGYSESVYSASKICVYMNLHIYIYMYVYVYIQTYTNTIGIYTVAYIYNVYVTMTPQNPSSP